MDCHPYVTNVAKLINEIGQQDGEVSRVVAKQPASISDALCKKVSTAFPHQCCFHRSKCDFRDTSSDKTKQKKKLLKIFHKKVRIFLKNRKRESFDVVNLSRTPSQEKNV